MYPMVCLVRERTQIMVRADVGLARRWRLSSLLDCVCKDMPLWTSRSH